MSRASRCLVPVLLLSSAVPAAAETATLTAVYEIRGEGTYASPDQVLRREWSVNDRFEVVARLTARPATPYPALHQPDTAHQATEANRAAAVARVADNMAPMMEQAAKIMERCGDDEACITRESIAMSQGIDMNSAAMKGARADIASASTMSAARYQLFEPTTQTGTFAIRESLKEQDRDPICMGRPNATCHNEISVQGSGASTHEGKTAAPATAMLELDVQKQTAQLLLPMPFPAEVTERRRSDKPGESNGERPVYRALSHLGLDGKVRHDCGALCRSANGSRRVEITDEISGNPATLTITWRLEIR